MKGDQFSGSKTFMQKEIEAKVEGLVGEVMNNLDCQAGFREGKSLVDLGTDRMKQLYNKINSGVELMMET